VWATVQDVKARWLTGEVPATDAQVQTLVDDAEDLVLSEFPGMETLVADGTVRQSTVVRVVSRMVLRVLRNPDGIRQIQETTGQFTGSQTYAGDNPGEVYLTDQDRRDLTGKRGARRAFTVSTIPRGWVA
jgi:hypothetical protein